MAVKKSKKDKHAIISATILLVSAFIFPLFVTSFFTQAFSPTGGTLVSLIKEFFKISPNFSDTSQLSALFIIIIFLALFITYLIAGLNKKYTSVARKISWVGFIYLLLGFYASYTINYKFRLHNAAGLLGVVRPGIGIWIVALISIYYIYITKK